MTLDGPGSDPFWRRKTTNNFDKRSKTGDKQDLDAIESVSCPQGSGTADDPTIAWLFDVGRARSISDELQRDHANIARQVARSLGFACIVIRKEAHSVGYTYTAIGTRTVTKDATGRERPVMAPSDEGQDTLSPP